MIHEILPVGPLQCNCSVIGDEASRKAIVIDPGDDVADVLAIVQKHNLKVQQIIITHAHIDHVGGAKKLQAATGAAVLLNQNDYALLKMLDMQAAWLGMAPVGKVEIDESVGQADKIRVGSLSADVLHTPGHTEGSVVYLYDRRCLFTGDSLAWNFETEDLEAFRRYCWWSWSEQRQSLKQLLNYRFEWVFAGHGGSRYVPSFEMHARLEALLERMAIDLNARLNLVFAIL